MKQCATPSILLALAISIAGCDQNNDATVKEFDIGKASEQQPQDETQHRSGDYQHHHAFANPEELAKKWNNPERDTWQHPEEIIAALALKPGATVADIGAGTGYMVAHLSKAVGPDGTIFAIDASAEMIEFLSKADLGPATIVPRKVGLNDPELNPGSVDFVLTLDTWHHMDSQEDYAKKVYLGLKPGGRFAVIDYEVGAETGPPLEMRLGPLQVTNHLEAAGFRVEVVPESMPRHYMVVGHKD